MLQSAGRLLTLWGHPRSLSRCSSNMASPSLVSVGTGKGQQGDTALGCGSAPRTASPGGPCGLLRAPVGCQEASSLGMRQSHLCLSAPALGDGAVKNLNSNLRSKSMLQLNWRTLAAESAWTDLGDPSQSPHAWVFGGSQRESTQCPRLQGRLHVCKEHLWATQPGTPPSFFFLGTVPARFFWGPAPSQ